jgi:thiol:disulfide interchange protein DsbD
MTMKKLISVTLLWLLTLASAFAEIPKADFSAMPLTTAQWPAQFQLTLKVPKDHHAYLDSGLDHAFLPITVDPKQKLTTSGLTVKLIKSPTGVFEQAVKATVLRETGEFIVELNQLGQQPMTETALEISYQLCNDISHVCFC